MDDTRQGDVDAANPVDEDFSLQLSEQEQQVLELYDQLEAYKLEVSFLQAQEVISDVDPTTVSENDLRVARDEMLEAKALYVLRNDIVKSILIANPILKAVHSGTNITPIERDILPLIKTRDEIDVFVTDTSSKVLSTTESLTRLESENITATRRNVALAAKMISLADEANTQKKEDIQDPQVREELDELEEELRRSRQRWRIMKETVSGVITGSGIDWARDPKLRDLVLDTTDDEA